MGVWEYEVPQCNESTQKSISPFLTIMTDLHSNCFKHSKGDKCFYHQTTIATINPFPNNKF